MSGTDPADSGKDIGDLLAGTGPPRTVWMLEDGHEYQPGDVLPPWEGGRRGVVFVGWGGVMSDDEFWLSVRVPGHPMQPEIDAGMQRICSVVKSSVGSSLVGFDRPHRAVAWKRSGCLRLALPFIPARRAWSYGTARPDPGDQPGWPGVA